MKFNKEEFWELEEINARTTKLFNVPMEHDLFSQLKEKLDGTNITVSSVIKSGLESFDSFSFEELSNIEPVQTQTRLMKTVSFKHTSEDMSEIRDSLKKIRDRSGMKTPFIRDYVNFIIQKVL